MAKPRRSVGRTPLGASQPQQAPVDFGAILGALQGTAQQATQQPLAESTRTSALPLAEPQASLASRFVTMQKGQPSYVQPAGDDFDGWLSQAAQIGGWDESTINAMRDIAPFEGGRLNQYQHGYEDVNSRSGDLALGPWQIIGQTFRGNAQAGYEDHGNPVHQALAAKRYMDARYGGPQNVLAKFQRQGHGGY